MNEPSVIQQGCAAMDECAVQHLEMMLAPWLMLCLFSTADLAAHNKVLVGVVPLPDDDGKGREGGT
jgi:hypothetical protein